jgi:hypothetical protein
VSSRYLRFVFHAQQDVLARVDESGDGGYSNAALERRVDLLEHLQYSRVEVEIEVGRLVVVFHENRLRQATLHGAQLERSMNLISLNLIELKLSLPIGRSMSAVK